MHRTQVQVDQRPQHKSSYMNLIDEKVRSSLECIDMGHYFLNITPVTQTLKAIINKWDLLKLKLLYGKGHSKYTKWQPRELRKIFTNFTSDRWHISKIYKEFKKLDIK